MRDPHVQRLHYRIQSSEHIRYKNPEPLHFDHPLGRFEASDGKLIVEPADHFTDAEAAQAVLYPFLRAWEIDADLRGNIGTIRFRFEQAEVIDRNPAPAGSTTVEEAVGTVAVFVAGTAVAELVMSKYPPPPDRFRQTVDVERLYRRWLDFRSGRARLSDAAYFILTSIESLAGDRTRNRRELAARTLNVSSKILNTVGCLADRGDDQKARKVPKSGHFEPLTPKEEAWLEQAVRLLIKRVGEHASGLPLDTLNMTDLPPVT